jgi:hypothetical protein
MLAGCAGWQTMLYILALLRYWMIMLAILDMLPGYALCIYLFCWLAMQVGYAGDYACSIRLQTMLVGYGYYAGCQSWLCCQAVLELDAGW